MTPDANLIDEALRLLHFGRVAELTGVRVFRVREPEESHTAAELGLSRSYAYELLTDADGHKARARKPSGHCIDCGKETSYQTGGPSLRCVRCGIRRSYAQGDRVDTRRNRERALRIVEWWAEGLTMRDIQERLGWSRGTLAAEMYRLRAKGYDLPYRQKSHPRRKAVAFVSEAARALWSLVLLVVLVAAGWVLLGLAAWAAYELFLVGWGLFQ